MIIIVNVSNGEVGQNGEVRHCFFPWQDIVDVLKNTVARAVEVQIIHNNIQNRERW